MGAALLRALATRRDETPPVLTRYNATDMVTEVFEDGRWVRSWESTALQSTKKCDMETGEDQKGV